MRTRKGGEVGQNRKKALRLKRMRTRHGNGHGKRRVRLGPCVCHAVRRGSEDRLHLDKRRLA